MWIFFPKCYWPGNIEDHTYFIQKYSKTIKKLFCSSKKATTNTHLHCKSLQTFITILWNIRSCSSLKVKGKQNTSQMNMTYRSFSYYHLMKTTALNEFKLFHEWQIPGVHTYNGAMPNYCLVSDSGEGMSNFCISFKPTGDLKACVIFGIAKVYHKWLYLSLSWESEFNLHFCFFSCSILTLTHLSL